MTFISFEFWFFLFILFFVYWNIKDKYKNCLLLTASFLFYVVMDITFFPILLLTIYISWKLGNVIYLKHNKKILVISIIFVLIPLFFYKYFSFFCENILSVLSLMKTKQDFTLSEILIPLGISFYSFTIIGYFIDIYQYKIKPESNFVKYALFISYFPKIISGPLERSKSFIDQLNKTVVYDYYDITYGFKQISWGIYKKYVVADTLAIGVNIIYSNLHEYYGLILFITSLLFSLQIYFDFSGYSEIALGISRMFGIKLSNNFDNPYFSSSIKEFWSRWHISLSLWLKNYIYIPLGGGHKGKRNQNMNILITFMVSGLWHGASWTFILWGLGHGIMRIFENIFCEKHIKNIPKLIRVIITFLIINSLWIFFRADTVSDAIYIFRYGFQDILSPVVYMNTFRNFIVLDKVGVLLLIFLVGLVIGFDICARKKEPITLIGEQNIFIRWSFYIVIVIIIILFIPKGFDIQFIYKQF